MSFLRAGAALITLAALIAAPARAIDGSFSVMGGVMTAGVWEDAILPWNAESYGSGVIGGAFERALGRVLGTEFSLEANGLAHFGKQEYLEFALPLVARYRPRQPWVPAFDSAALGLGLSWASAPPQVEVDRHGESQRMLVTWFVETAFDLPDTRTDVFFRLHHRSDAFGLFPVDTGSNALLLGLRRPF